MEANSESTYNSLSHFILYSKGWYKRGDLMDDMKTLMSEYTGIRKEYISESDLFCVLTEATFDYIVISGNPLLEFQHYTKNLKERGWISACLSVLSQARVSGMNICEPDPNILPLYDGD